MQYLCAPCITQSEILKTAQATDHRPRTTDHACRERGLSGFLGGPRGLWSVVCGLWGCGLGVCGMCILLLRLNTSTHVPSSNVSHNNTSCSIAQCRPTPHPAIQCRWQQTKVRNARSTCRNHRTTTPGLPRPRATHHDARNPSAQHQLWSAVCWDLCEIYTTCAKVVAASAPVHGLSSVPARGPLLPFAGAAPISVGDPRTRISTVEDDEMSLGASRGFHPCFEADATGGS